MPQPVDETDGVSLNPLSRAWKCFVFGGSAGPFGPPATAYAPPARPAVTATASAQSQRLRVIPASSPLTVGVLPGRLPERSPSRASLRGCRANGLREGRSPATRDAGLPVEKPLHARRELAADRSGRML